MPLLKPGDPFPELTITTADDQTLTLPGAFAGDFSVVLLYGAPGARTATPSCAPSSGPARRWPATGSASPPSRPMAGMPPPRWSPGTS